MRGGVRLWGQRLGWTHPLCERVGGVRGAGVRARGSARDGGSFSCKMLCLGRGGGWEDAGIGGTVRDKPRGQRGHREEGRSPGRKVPRAGGQRVGWWADIGVMLRMGPGLLGFLGAKDALLCLEFRQSPSLSVRGRGGVQMALGDGDSGRNTCDHRPPAVQPVRGKTRPQSERYAGFPTPSPQKGYDSSLIELDIDPMLRWTHFTYIGFTKIRYQN